MIFYNGRTGKFTRVNSPEIEKICFDADNARELQCDNICDDSFYQSSEELGGYENEAK